MKNNQIENVLAKTKKKKAQLACKICAAFFISKTDLKVHKKYQHSIEKKMMCQCCTDVFSSKTNLKVHISDKHSGFCVTCVVMNLK